MEQRQWGGFMNEMIPSKILLGATLDAIIAIDSDGTILYVNAAMTSLLGWGENALLGRNVSMLMNAGDSDRHDSYISRYLQTRKPQIIGIGREVMARHRDGTLIPVGLTIAEFTFKEGTYFVGTLRDLRDRRRIERQLAEMKRHDPLTGLFNRQAFVREARLVLSGSDRDGIRNCCLLALDFVKFSTLNNRLGLRTGDQTLKSLMIRLEKTCPPRSIIGRMYSDQFAVLLYDRPYEECLEIACEISANLSKPFGTGQAVDPVRTRIAVTRISRQDTDVEETFSALEKLKKTRIPDGGLIEFSDTARDDLHRLISLENDIARALDSGEITAYGQPIVGARDRRVRAVELLARWQHPVHGTIAPDQFIAMIERQALGLTLVRKQIADAARLLADAGLVTVLKTYTDNERNTETDAGPDAESGPGTDHATGPAIGTGTETGTESDLDGGLKIFVNCSARVLLQGDFTAMLQDLLDEFPYLTGRLGIELTEQESMHHSELGAGIMADLHDMGVAVAIDDFGTGYSSLAYLLQLNPEKIKIDRSFVSNMLDDWKSLALCESIAGIAHAMKLDVVAEGVETEGQAAKLQALGVKYLQGYLFSKPLPLDGLTDLLRSGGRLQARRQDTRAKAAE